MTKERFFLCPAGVKNGMTATIRKRGVGVGRKEMLADKPLDFENPVRQQLGLLTDWTSFSEKISRFNCCH